MGIIKVLSDAIDSVKGAIEGGLADQFLEVIEPDDMGPNTVFTSGVMVRRDGRRHGNTQGTEGIISDGSVIHVYDNQFMMLVDGGKVIDYTAEPGYFQVKNASAPSAFRGQLDEAVQEAFMRIQYGGVPSAKQQVFFINLQEIKGLKFGTRNAINYFDTFYNAELFLRAYGTYSVRITNPLKFYQEVVPRNARRLEMNEVDEQFLNEFLEALQSAINKMSADGERISHVTSKSRELSRYMSDTLDEDWQRMRGMEVQSVGIASVSYDPESQKLINMRNQGAMLSDPSVREGYVQGAIARGVEAAGSNAAGSAAGFMGVGFGMQAGGNAAAAFSQSNQAQMDRQAASNPAPSSRIPPTAPSAPAPRTAPPATVTPAWKCGNCGHENAPDSKFCSECGQPRPTASVCGKCGHQLPPGVQAKFCPECGAPL